MTTTEAILVGLVLIFYLLGAIATMMLLHDEHDTNHPRRWMLEVTLTWWLSITVHWWHFLKDEL